MHLTGGVVALVATSILGPRKGRYSRGSEAPPLGNGMNVIVGTFYALVSGHMLTMHRQFYLVLFQR